MNASVEKFVIRQLLPINLEIYKIESRIENEIAFISENVFPQITAYNLCYRRNISFRLNWMHKNKNNGSTGFV